MTEQKTYPTFEGICNPTRHNAFTFHEHWEKYGDLWIQDNPNLFTVYYDWFARVCMITDCKKLLHDSIHHYLPNHYNGIASIASRNPNVANEDLLYFLSRCSNSEHVEDRVYAASHEKTPLDVILRLTNDLYTSIPMAIAQNPAITEEVFLSLRDHSCLNVQLELVRNPNCPQWLLEEYGIYLDSDFHDIYYEIAANKKTPPYILDNLSKLENPFICENILKNPNVSQETIDKINKLNKLYNPFQS